MIAQIESIGASRPKIGFAELEKLNGSFDTEAARLDELVAALNADLEDVKSKHLPALKRQAAVVARREAEGRSAVEGAPELFVKPRTITIHGVKCGFTTSEGALVFDSAETTVALIEKKFGKDAVTYLNIKKTPNKDALKTLPDGDLKKIGCRIEGAGDAVIFKRVAGDVEKLVEKLIKKFVEAMVGAKED